MERNDLISLLKLNNVKGVGFITYQSLMEYFGRVSAIERASAEQLRKVHGVGPKTAEAIKTGMAAFDAERELDEAEQMGVTVLGIHSSGYPANLKSTYDPPLILYVKGRLTERDNIGFAVVGSRRATTYGKIQAERISRQLSSMGMTVVSGLARGIDTAAHKGALAGGGRTIAVLGCGLPEIYPRDNTELAAQIEEKGALISEFALHTPPDRKTFPRRNRIISGLSMGILVVESARHGGAMITAMQAMEQGRDVFAVPGQVSCSLSQGPHRLIRDGATLVESVDDILAEYSQLSEHLDHSAEEEGFTIRRDTLDFRELAILDIVSDTPVNIDDIIQKADLPPFEVSAALTKMEIKHLIKRLPGRYFQKNERIRVEADPQVAANQKEEDT